MLDFLIKRSGQLAWLVAGVFLGLAASQATASTLSWNTGDIGTSYSQSLTLSCDNLTNCSGTPWTGVSLSMSAVLKLVQYDAGTNVWTFSAVLNNTSSVPTGVSAGGLVGFGFDTNVLNPSVALADTSLWPSTTGWTAGLGKISGSFPTQVCLWSGNNCQAGNDQLAPGKSATVYFTIASSLGTLSFDNFAAKMAGVYCTDSTDGSSSCSYEFGTPVSTVPIPATGFLLIGALGGLGLMRKRRKAA